MSSIGKGIPAVRRSGKATPPGGGACFWCAGLLSYKKAAKKDKDGRLTKIWSYAEIEEQGHVRAVHLTQCTGPDAELRLGGGLDLAEER